MTVYTPDGQIAKVLADLMHEFKIDPETADAVRSLLVPASLKKGEDFLRVGEVCKRLGILVSGLLYARYQPDNNKDECVSRFFSLKRNFIVTNFESYQSGMPSHESITAMESSFLFFINKESLEELYKKYPLLNVIGRHLAETSYIAAARRIRSLQVLNAKERVAECHEQQPELFVQVKKKDLASYLGINRNEIAKYLKKYTG